MLPISILRCAMGVMVTLALYDVTCRADDISDSMLLATLKRSDRRDDFQSMNDLSDYLGELKQYYTVVGRPR